MSAPRIYSPDNPPAFPLAFEHENESGVSAGMSLRDYFAAAALAGILHNYTTAKFGVTESGVAEGAYQFADAMLRARKEAAK